MELISITCFRDRPAAAMSHQILSRCATASYVPGELIPLPLSGSIPELPHVAKAFWGGERKFLEPLMRFTRGEVRDHIVSSRIDHAPP
jgi:hypothetical protein